MRIPFGAKPLDGLFGGGVESGTVTLLYGEGGSGKTNLCLVLARNVARMKRKVVYVDTEGVSIERLAQVCGATYEKDLKNIVFFKPHSFEEQETMVLKVSELVEKADVGLFILDSATVFYRLGFGGGHRESQKDRASLGIQLIELQRIARQKDIPVLITTQVYYDAERASVEPIGGHMMWHNAKTIVKLEKAGGSGGGGVDEAASGERKATLIKHRSQAEGGWAPFKISGAGVE
ncbi:MAG TPA: DNA repair and recombination protein RadB [Thermoplasmata archaeon]|nr:DNA repair and recombination protein RadB [Thermoplasmata archaeon]